MLRRYLPLATLFFAIASLYLYNLDGVGVLLPDEPRYAAIGRSMAQSGDWITPRLWGEAWFEKPPLLYWMTAAATSFGIAPELSARLPIALLSLFFLGVFFALSAAAFGRIAASAATALLATSAGWIVYSSLSLTDIPLACFFSIAILVLLPLLQTGSNSSKIRWMVCGFCLGAAVLAKGLVPMALALPIVWFFRRFWRHWWIGAIAFLVTAAPWYLTVYYRNGWPFVQEFFFKHHLERLYSKSLQHVQPWYFYFPVLLGAVFPWTPLLGLVTRINRWDERRRFLLSTFVFGFLFFSVSLNKLNGYLLPLLPAVFLLVGSYFEDADHFPMRKQWLVPCGILIATIPLLAQALPAILSAGRLISIQPFSGLSPAVLFYIAAPIAIVFLARRSWTGTLLVLCVVLEGLFLKVTTYPLLDKRVSARVFWQQQVAPIQDQVCEAWIKRDWVYGLSFYRGALIPSCYNKTFRYHLMPRPRDLPAIVEQGTHP